MIEISCAHQKLYLFDEKYTVKRRVFYLTLKSFVTLEMFLLSRLINNK